MVSEYGVVILVFALGAVVFSGTGVYIAVRLARRTGLMDIPNERSSHAFPTPRVGGMPMAATAVLALVSWSAVDRSQVLADPRIANLLWFCTAMALLGFLDDLRNLPPMHRFVAQMTGALFMVLPWISFFPIIGLAGWIVPQALWLPIAAFWVVWMLNLYNFMDGIDGLAGGEAVAASLFFFLLFTYFGEPGWAAANLFVAAAAMGFLLLNWAPARVFMGDAGSGFLGAFYGMQSVAAHLTTQVPFPVLILPFANFVLDATITLFRRVLSNERWYEAHRSHVYQRMANFGWSHQSVAILELVVVVISCLTAAACVHATISMRVLLTSILLAGIASVGIWIVRRERISSP